MKKDEKLFDMGGMITLSLAHFAGSLFENKSKTVFTKKEIKKQLKETAGFLNEQFRQLGLDFDEPVKFKKSMPFGTRD